MTMRIGSAIAFAAFAWLQPAPLAAQPAGEGYVLLEPARDGAGAARVEAAPDGRSLPVLQGLRPGPLRDGAERVMASQLPRLIVRLDAAARQSAPAPVCDGLGGNLFVYFSDEDGGFARRDFFYADEAGRTTLCRDFYVDITVTQPSLEYGEYEEILAHEWGHVLLRRLLGPVPPTPSRKFHSVLAVTDPVTAFDEGFGIHMQPQAGRLTATPGFASRIAGAAPPSPADLWFSRRETWQREHWVPANQLVFRPRSVPAGDPYRRWLEEERTAARDPCRLRTGDQLLASEGFVAGFFYKLLARDGDALAERYSRLVRVLAAMRGWGERPLLDLIRQWSALYPEDRPELVGLLLDLSHGAVASRAAAARAAELSCLGAAGDAERFIPALSAHREAMAALRADVLSGATAIDAALGPPLWIANPNVLIQPAPWQPRRDLPLVVNLNTAEEAELALALGGTGIREPAIARILAERDADGPYANLGDLARRAGISATEGRILGDLIRAYATLPRYVRE